MVVPGTLFLPFVSFGTLTFLLLLSDVKADGDGLYILRPKIDMYAGLRALFVQCPARPLQIPSQMSVSPCATLIDGATPSQTPGEHRTIIGTKF